MARLEGSCLVTPVDVFYESARLLDFMLSNSDISQYQVDSLWNLLLVDIMKWDINVTDYNKKIIAGSVFQIVRATLTQFYDGYYSETVCEQLSHTIELNMNGCDEKEQTEFLKRLMEQTPMLSDWINSYDEADEWLSDQIADVINAYKEKSKDEKVIQKSPKTASKKNKRECPPIISQPMTLKYFTIGNNRVLKEQQRRVDIVFRKFSEWHWIDNKTSSDDFDSLFKGEARHCNIVWKAKTSLLTYMLQELLQQSYIMKQIRQSARSMVKEQFNLTPNFDQKRITEDDKIKISLTIYILNINNPLPQKQGGRDNYFDTSDAAFYEVLSGQLRTTKGI